MSDITLGCSNYLQLIQKGVPEFSQRSIVCLDADQNSVTQLKKFKTIVLLPGTLPPDQLIFEHLYNLPSSDDFWKNDLHFTRDVFTNLAREVISEFTIFGNTTNIKEQVANYSGSNKPREVFKRFYKDAVFQKLVTSGSKPYNPWKHWVENNPQASNYFLTKLMEAIQGVMKNGYAVDVSKLAGLEVKLKRL